MTRSPEEDEYELARNRIMPAGNNGLPTHLKDKYCCISKKGLGMVAHGANKEALLYQFLSKLQPKTWYDLNTLPEIPQHIIQNPLAAIGLAASGRFVVIKTKDEIGPDVQGI